MSVEKKDNIIALIPARGGSKGIPRKNIIDIAGFPLIAYTITAARLAKLFDRIIVSTDDEEIADIARIYGAEVPFMRPQDIAQDHSHDREFIVHALDWFHDNEYNIPEYIVHLRPTTPLRSPEHMDEAIQKLLNHKNATALRSAHEVKDIPFKNLKIEGEYFEGLFPHDSRSEYYNLPRQIFPQTYHVNGYIDIMKSSFMLRGESLHGTRMIPFITKEAEDIDTPENRERVIGQLQTGEWEIYKYLKENFK